MPTTREMFLARIEQRVKEGKNALELRDRDLVVRQKKREEETKKQEASAKELAKKVFDRKNASPRKTMMIGGAGGHEGGSPSARAPRYVDDREADGGYGSPVRRRPADSEYERAGIRGEVVRTTGMSREITDKPSPSGRRNTAGQQPNPMSGHGGRYVSEDMMTDNRKTHSPLRPPSAKFSGKLGYKEGGIVKAKRVGKPSAWISHVKAYQTQHGVSYRDAMVQAKATYQK
jgi:hypothetical protein